MPSQYNEDDIIKQFFGEKRDGRFLDIGAYDGKTFSNTFALAERGWSGVCVEASPQCFYGMQKTYDQNPNIRLVSAAVATENGCVKFYDNGGAVASMNEKHKAKWEVSVPFKEIYVMAITPYKLLEMFPGPYDFVSIDIEGDTLFVLSSFPSLKELEVTLVCVEVDGGKTPRADAIMDRFGFVLEGITTENRLYKRK